MLKFYFLNYKLHNWKYLKCKNVSTRKKMCKNVCESYQLYKMSTGQIKHNIINEIKKTKTYNNSINDEITQVHITLHCHHPYHLPRLACY